MQQQLISLDLMMPLKRGYALVYSNNIPITSIKDLSPSQRIEIKIHDGDVQAIIETMKENYHD